MLYTVHHRVGSFLLFYFTQLYWDIIDIFSSIAQLCLTLRLYEPQHARPPCPSPTPGVHPNPCPLSRWCHPTISSSVIPFSSCLQSFPASGSFQMSQLFASGGQSVGVSASTSVLPVNTQDWSPLGWTGWNWSISLYKFKMHNMLIRYILQNDYYHNISYYFYHIT